MKRFVREASVEVADLIARAQDLMSYGVSPTDAIDQTLKESHLLDGLYQKEVRLPNPRGIDVLVRFGLLHAVERRRSIAERR